MSSDIKITGEPVSNLTCRFVVDRPVHENAAYFFNSSEVAQSSPLAATLFAIEGVRNVLISHNVVTVSKAGQTEWPVIGKQIGAAIRAHLGGDRPAIDPALLASIPPVDEIRQRVQMVIEREITPQVALHGGSISLVDVRANNVYIRMGGGCQGCGMAGATLKLGVESAIRRAVPEVGEILDTTDHAAGHNPYYDGKAEAGHRH